MPGGAIMAWRHLTYGQRRLGDVGIYSGPLSEQLHLPKESLDMDGGSGLSPLHSE